MAASEDQTFVILIDLKPRFTAELSRPGVVDAIASAARAGKAPSLEELLRLGQPHDFAAAFVERLQYLVDLKKVGRIRSAGPFDGNRSGMYLCTAADQEAARRIIENDPLYRAGLIEPSYRIERWQVAI